MEQQNGSTPCSPATETALIGGGCFWCLEAVFKELQGVVGVASGYSGGTMANPSYTAVCRGDTGHAEVVRVDYDPACLSYREVLEVFFTIHDPTTVNRQGNDIGTQYRSAIYYLDPAQQAIAHETIAHLNGLGIFPGPIVTEVAPAGTFYPAEAYHQDYYANNPEQAYCQFVVYPKVAKFREKFAHRRKPAG